MKLYLLILSLIVTQFGFSQIEEKVRRVERLDDSGVIVYFSKGMTFYDFGNYAHAIDDFSYLLEHYEKIDTSILHKSGLDSVLVLNYRATSYARIGEVEKAVNDYKTIHSITSNDSLLKINCMRVYFNYDRCEEAVALVDGSENNIEELNDAALCYLKLQNFEKAFDFIEKAKTLQPDNFLVYKTEGKYYKEVGNQKASCEAFRKAISKLRSSKDVPERNKGHLEEVILKEMGNSCVMEE